MKNIRKNKGDSQGVTQVLLPIVGLLITAKGALYELGMEAGPTQADPANSRPRTPGSSLARSAPRGAGSGARGGPRRPRARKCPPRSRATTAARAGQDTATPVAQEGAQVVQMYLQYH